MPLTDAQIAALRHVESVAAALAEKSERDAQSILENATVTLPFALLVEGFRRRARLTLHFHPDRLLPDGSTVADRLLIDGAYRSQFATGISNGGLTAFAGGDRDRWEEGMFGGAYQRPGTLPDERPVYAALDLHQFGDGAAPRFGATYFTLHHEVLQRTTLSAEDSVFLPTTFATYREPRPLITELLRRAQDQNTILGHSGMDVKEFCVLLITDRLDGAGRTNNHGRAMDDYVEAAIHGGVFLHSDVSSITTDPSYRGTDTELALRLMAGKYGLKLNWHQGFRLQPSRVPHELRDPLTPQIAARVVAEFGDGEYLDVHTVGQAARSVNLEPGRWADLGSHAEALQHMKYLWHVLVLEGEPITG